MLFSLFTNLMNQASHTLFYPYTPSPHPCAVYRCFCRYSFAKSSSFCHTHTPYKPLLCLLIVPCSLFFFRSFAHRLSSVPISLCLSSLAPALPCSISLLAPNHARSAVFPFKTGQTSGLPYYIPVSLGRFRPFVSPNAPRFPHPLFSRTKKAPIARCFLLSAINYTSRSIFGKKSAKVTFASSIGGRL